MKLQKLSELQPTLPFTEFDLFKKYRDNFKYSELGAIYEQLPIKELSDFLQSKLPKLHPQGRKQQFPMEGQVALMFLRPYTGLGDDALAQMLNGNINMQIFCGVYIDPSSPLKDGKIISAIRNRLASVLDIRELQHILFDRWKGGLTHLDRLMTDATCYESLLRFPTDIKLMWECCDWLHMLTTSTCKSLGERQPRNKFCSVSKARLAYAKQRRPQKSATRRMQRRVLKLLGKLIGQWNRLRSQFSPEITLTAEQEKRLIAIAKVYEQQHEVFQGNKVKHRIVSIDRPYIRPIVRGKENKRVEFGAKVNNIQIDGISFIEHCSFEAFNEGIRLRQCIEYQQKLTGVDVKEIGADSIYANNANHTYCTENGILTSFARKGVRPKADECRAVRRILGNVRATAMEGSFGNQKQHYNLGHVAARNSRSEVLQIFFGVHMANAAILASRKIAEEENKLMEQKRKAG